MEVKPEEVSAPADDELCIYCKLNLIISQESQELGIQSEPELEAERTPSCHQAGASWLRKLRKFLRRGVKPQPQAGEPDIKPVMLLDILKPSEKKERKPIEELADGQNLSPPCRSSSNVSQNVLAELCGIDIGDEEKKEADEPSEQPEESKQVEQVEQSEQCELCGQSELCEHREQSQQCELCELCDHCE